MRGYWTRGAARGTDYSRVGCAVGRWTRAAGGGGGAVIAALAHGRWGGHRGEARDVFVARPVPARGEPKTDARGRQCDAVPATALRAEHPAWPIQRLAGCAPCRSCPGFRRNPRLP